MELFKLANGYVPLLVNLEGHWEKSLAQLPDELRPIVEQAFFCFPWDELSVENRRRGAARRSKTMGKTQVVSRYYTLNFSIFLEN